MARRNSNQKETASKIPSRIWSYGCRPPTVGAELVEKQLRLAHDYYNKLALIHRKSQERKKHALMGHPGVAALSIATLLHWKELEDLKLAIRSGRSETRERPPLSDIEKARLRDAGDKHYKARRALTDLWLKIQMAADAMSHLDSFDGVTPLDDKERKKVEKSKARIEELRKSSADSGTPAALRFAGSTIPWKRVEAVLKVLKSEEDESRLAAKAARTEFRDLGLFWGTYLITETAFDSAKELRIDLHTGWPKIVRGKEVWDGGGRIGVQVQGGMTVGEMFGSGTWLQIAPVPELAFHSLVRGERRRLARTRVKLRVGSNGRAPIWAEWPMVLHREPPKNARIKWAWIIKEKIGCQFRWTLQVTFQDKSFAPPIREGQTAGIDIGWRKMGENDIRIAYLQDEDGIERDIRLPPDIIIRLRKADELRSLRDHKFNIVRKLLCYWLRKAKQNGVVKVKEELAKMFEHLHSWRSTARLSSAVWDWGQTMRFEGDEKIWARMEKWRKRDKHLYLWEANSRDEAIARRTDFYRKLACDLAKTYAVVKLEDFDLRDVAERADVDEEDAHQEARHQRFMASLSSFRLILKSTCQREGTLYQERPAANTTRKCNKCTHTEKFDAAASVMRTCPKCGEVWDQDQNAGANLLRD